MLFGRAPSGRALRLYASLRSRLRDFAYYPSRNPGEVLNTCVALRNVGYIRVMGLDTTHDCWHGAYSAFMRWRRGIAKAAGIPLDLMEGFWSLDEYKQEILEKNMPRKHAFAPSESGGFVATRDSLSEALAERIGRGDAGVLADELSSIAQHLPIRWDALKPDPIHYLLNHSDCEGHIAWSHCKKLADRLEELLPLLPEEDAGGHIGVWREKTQMFIDGLRLAHSKKERVEFH